jgi:hypothetical protein
LGLAGVGGAPALAALDPAVVEAVEAPEVVALAQGIAAVLESADPSAEEQELVGALHAYLSEVDQEAAVLQQALDVVLAGDWTETQLAALRGLFGDYAPADLDAPRGGGALVPPAAAGGAILTAAASEEESASVSRAQLEAVIAPPPPPSGGGGTDYRQ